MKFASEMAVTGFATKLNNKFFKISARLPGGTRFSAATSRINVLGKIILAITALSAAKNMPKAYINIIGLMYALLLPTLKFAMDDSTSTKTSIGATDFNALMNKSPSKLKYGATPGATTATNTPKIMAMIIRVTKLKRVNAENIGEPCQNYNDKMMKISPVFYTKMWNA